MEFRGLGVEEKCPERETWWEVYCEPAGRGRFGGIVGGVLLMFCP